MVNTTVEQATEKNYYGLTLSQHAERIRKLAAERGLKDDVLERVIAQAVAMIPTIRLGDRTQH